MFPFKNDIIRLFRTYDRKATRKRRFNSQLSYCLKNFDKDTAELTPQQLQQVRDRWDKISFACPVDPRWHQMYTSKTGQFSTDYIPNELHYYLVEYSMIDFDYLRAFTDKNYLGLLFPEIKQPPVAIRCIRGLFYDQNYVPISKEQALTKVKERLLGGVVFKPSINSWGGRSISFFKEDMTKDQLRKIFGEYGDNFIVQQVIKQHPALDAIHSESVNTMRIITILMDGEVTLLSACLRMGVGQSQVDNFSQGGVGCGIMENGQLRSIGYDRFGKQVSQHPDGFHFEDCVIPNYQTVINTVKAVAKRVPMFGVASWDFALDETGTPVLIEYNVAQGGIDIHQFNNGPLYGDKTDQIIDRICKRHCVEDMSLQYNYNVFYDHVTVKTASKSMKWIYIKDSHHDHKVTRIGELAFERAKVRRVRLPKGLQAIDRGAFLDCKALCHISLPTGLTDINRSAFSGCSGLKKLVLPDTVTFIGKWAFRSTGDLQITIPASVTSIADDAFEDCTSVHIYGKENSYACEYAKLHNYTFSCY